MSFSVASLFIRHSRHVCFFRASPRHVSGLRKSLLSTLLAHSLYQTPFGDHERCAPHVVHHVALFPEGVLVLSSAVSPSGAALSVSLARELSRNSCIQPSINRHVYHAAQLRCLVFPFGLRPCASTRVTQHRIIISHVCFYIMFCLLISVCTF